jgi:glutamate-1-semialdehyde 2,1-aminomutase
MNGAEMMAFTGEVMSSDYVMNLMGRVAAEQPVSNALVARVREASVGNPTQWPFHAVPLPVAVQSAQGSRLVDADGRERIDLFLGFGTQSLHGHNPPEVVEAVRQALGSTVGNGYFNEIELKLVDLLRDVTGNEAFVFLHSGTEATGAAVRIARAATGKRLVVKVESATHGTHDWGVQSSVALMHGHPFVPWPKVDEHGVESLPFAKGVSPSSPVDLLIVPHLDERAFEMIRARRDEIACVIAEPSNVSFPFPDKCVPFTKRLSKLCQDEGLLFVLDEVQTGFRWGIGGAAVTEDIHADLRVYGKVLSGLGIPLSAVGGPMTLLDHARTTGVNLADFGQKTTFMSTHMGHHMALLASHASLSLLQQKGEAFYTRTRARIARLRERLAVLRRDEGIPIHAVGYGDFIGLLMVGESPHLAADARGLAHRVNPAASLLLSLALRARGFYTYSWPFLFLGDAYSDDDMARIEQGVVDSLIELRDAGVALTTPWGARL